MERTERRKLGICYDCHEPAVTGKCRCEKHTLGSSQAAKRFATTPAGKIVRRDKAKVFYARHRDEIHRHKREEGRFAYVRRSALGKGKSWSLTKEQYEPLVVLPCAYCECENNVQAGIGLDRLDNSRGYDIDNVVSCCIECNIARGDRFTPEEMKLIGAAIAEVKRLRATLRG
jgi:hypothetical protein